jgi:hypothetical protein
MTTEKEDDDDGGFAPPATFDPAASQQKINIKRGLVEKKEKENENEKEKEKEKRATKGSRAPAHARTGRSACGKTLPPFQQPSAFSSTKKQKKRGGRQSETFVLISVAKTAIVVRANMALWGSGGWRRRKQS